MDLFSRDTIIFTSNVTLHPPSLHPPRLLHIPSSICAGIRNANQRHHALNVCLALCTSWRAAVADGGAFFPPHRIARCILMANAVSVRNVKYGSLESRTFEMKELFLVGSHNLTNVVDCIPPRHVGIVLVWKMKKCQALFSCSTSSNLSTTPKHDECHTFFMSLQCGGSSRPRLLRWCLPLSSSIPHYFLPLAFLHQEDWRREVGAAACQIFAHAPLPKHTHEGHTCKWGRDGYGMSDECFGYPSCATGWCQTPYNSLIY